MKRKSRLRLIQKEGYIRFAGKRVGEERFYRWRSFRAATIDNHIFTLTLATVELETRSKGTRVRVPRGKFAIEDSAKEKTWFDRWQVAAIACAESISGSRTSHTAYPHHLSNLHPPACVIYTENRAIYSEFEKKIYASYR